MGHFTTWHNFLSMGGYAMYVWPAYGVVMFVLLLGGLSSVRRLRHALRDIKRFNEIKRRQHADKT